MLARLAPKYAEQQQAFANAVTASTTLKRLCDARSMVTTSVVERRRARKELDALVAAFPGATSFWWMAFRLAEADDDEKAAWDALSKARRLAPENPRFEAMSLLVAAWALSVAEADEHLTRVGGRFDTAGAEACLMYALAEIQLARRSKVEARRARWKRAHHAAQAGLSQSRSERLYKNLVAAELLIATLLAGDRPTMDILYRAGLANLAVTSSPTADVVELFTESVRTAA
jgi:predicted Zn-dependent protease